MVHHRHLETAAQLDLREHETITTQHNVTSSSPYFRHGPVMLRDVDVAPDCMSGNGIGISLGFGGSAVASGDAVIDSIDMMVSTCFTASYGPENRTYPLNAVSATVFQAAV